ncbi:hypothetical protein BBP40_004055 [Aspergillus hancockii]|nr:hypothetical protein BBP40_004055 [Aspergillus hancockii]
MKTAKPDIFYREQALANLRFLFGKDADILTCQSPSREWICFAYFIRNEERVKVMQSANLDLVSAMYGLLATTAKYLRKYITAHNHEIEYKDLASCEIALPLSSVEIMLPWPKLEAEPSVSHIEGLSLPEDSAPNEGFQPVGEEKHTLKIEVEGESKQPLEFGDATRETEDCTICLTPQSAKPCSDAVPRGYSILIDIQYPFKSPIGAMRYLEIPTRQALLQAASQVITKEVGKDNNPFVVKRLSVKMGNSSYDILGYERDHIGHLLDNVLEVEKLPIIQCVYGKDE